MKIIKIAGKNEDDIHDVKMDIKDLDSDIKDNKDEIKRIKAQLSDLNIGTRIITQNKDIFHSLQRKLEKFDKMLDEWEKFKSKEKAKEVESKR